MTAKEKIEKIGKIERIMENLINDPEFREESEKYQKKFGTLTEKDLRETFTI